MQHLKITIPTPCTADWSRMTAADKGKHCSACNKVVIDFTSMTEGEIKNFFVSKSQEGVCGHFKKTQLEEKHYLLKLKSKWAAAKKTPFKYGALFVLGIAITLTGCDDKRTIGELKVEKKVIEKHTTTGITIADVKDSVKHKNDEEIMITGDTVVEPK